MCLVKRLYDHDLSWKIPYLDKGFVPPSYAILVCATDLDRFARGDHAVFGASDIPFAYYIRLSYLQVKINTKK